MHTRLPVCLVLIAFALAFVVPAPAYAALININTADAALLDTLPGIGPTYAARIVDYRTAHGPFARTEDIQNVSGIGPSTYADIAAFITVGDTGATPASSSATASSTSSTPAASGAATPYAPPPATLSVEINGNQSALLEVPVSLSARATIKGGAIDPSARIFWSFGDGSSGEGSVIQKTYRYSGTYLVTVTASDGPTSARSELVVMVTQARVRLLPVSGDGITIVNDSHERLDLSGWELVSDTGLFRIPNGTTLLPESGVLFPFTIINLPQSADARLLYPNGVIAARSLVPAIPIETTMQLSEATQSFNTVQTVDTITSTNADIQTHDEAVSAPTATAEPVAVGAVSVPPEEESAAVTSAPAARLIRSPWTLGFLGIVALASGAFILL